MKRKRKFTYTFNVYDNSSKGKTMLGGVHKKKGAKIKVKVDTLILRNFDNKLIYKGPQILIRGNKEGLLYFARTLIVIALSNYLDTKFHDHLEPIMKGYGFGNIDKGSSPVVIEKSFNKGRKGK